MAVMGRGSPDLRLHRSGLENYPGYRCLCAGPANASAAFPDDLEALRGGLGGGRGETAEG